MKRFTGLLRLVVSLELALLTITPNQARFQLQRDAPHSPAAGMLSHQMAAVATQ